MTPPNYPYSHHHFLFPFRWDRLKTGFKLTDKKENFSFDDRTRLDGGLENLLGELWERKPLKGSLTADQYNHFTYFHEFVRKAIYDFDYPGKKNQDNQENPVMMYFEYNLTGKKLCYEIEHYIQKNYNLKYPEKYKKENYIEAETLILSLKGITLHFYNTGVGVLSFNLENNTYKEKETILLINELGRRIYPQFLGADGSFDAKRIFLAKSITLFGLEEWKEDFNWYEPHNGNLLPERTFNPPAFIRNLFSDDIIFEIQADLSKDKMLITKVTDDRMFFVSWYGNNYFSKRVGENYKVCDWWYAYIFGDKTPKSIANAGMQYHHLLEHTYERWSEYGTLFGLSRDSLVCLSCDVQTMVEKNYPRLDNHINSIYYQIAVLCLVQRASTLKFGAEVSNQADLAKNKPDEEKLIENVKELYKNYIEFINKIYFREITSQIQGIEFYKKFQTVMNIENDVKDLDGEFQELHQYVSMQSDHNRNKKALELNIVASIFLPATFLASVFALFSDREFNFRAPVDKDFVIVLTILLITLFASLFFYKPLINLIKKITDPNKK